MKRKTIILSTYILAALPMIVFLAMYRILPEQMPVHWGIDGAVRYDSKNTFFMIAGMNIFMALMFHILPHVDPRKANYQKFQKYYDFFCIFMVLFMDVVCGIILLESMKPGMISVGVFVPAMVGLVFMVTGNMMPKLKNNFYIGVKTPWALCDNDVWNKTNRLGGRLMFWCGLILIPAAVLLPSRVLFALLMVIVLIVSGIPTIMSYLWYKKKYR